MPLHLPHWLRRHRRRILTGLVVLAAFSLLGASLYSTTCGLRGCPSIQDIQAFRPSEGGRVLDRHDDLLGHLNPVRRVVVPLDRVPRRVREAFIAVEDRRFYRHHGVDWRGIGRALWRDVTSLGVREGASTLTMQVVRSGFLDGTAAPRLGRKLIELHLAPKIEKTLSKDQILGLYLNLIYLGEGTYGVEAASREYFGKSVSRLSLAEAATLAALPRAPSVYDPRDYPDRAVARRNLVLGLMARQGFISGREAERASHERLRVSRRGWDPRERPSYAVAAARAFVDSAMRGHRWYGEITIHTSFDRDAQGAAERAVRDRAAAIGRKVEGAMVALDPRTGGMLATVGGTEVPGSGFDRATAARRQPGSAFKPFVYAAAMLAGLTPATLVDDVPVEVDNDGHTWRPANYGDDYAGRVTLRDALTLSANAATVRVSQSVGIRPIADLAHRMGIESRLPPVPSLALGSAEVTPLELVAGYVPLANGGYRVEPWFVRSIETGGRVVYRARPPERRQVLDSVTAFLVTSMLQSVVDEGTGNAIRRYGVYGPAAGKTGTTNNGDDVWFVGYTPTIVAGFWFGRDTPSSLGRGASGGRLAAPAWASFFRHGWNDNGEGWEVPDGVVQEEIDPESGMLAGWYCPTTRREWFRKGTEPTQRCNLHQGNDWTISIGSLKVRVRAEVRDLIQRMREAWDR